jgi:hypothetical protein
MTYYITLYEHDAKFRNELLKLNDGHQLLGEEETQDGKIILWSYDRKRRWFRLKIPKGW